MLLRIEKAVSQRGDIRSDKAEYRNQQSFSDSSISQRSDSVLETIDKDTAAVIVKRD